ncbi:MAG: DNA-binding protein [Spirochaetes bacterium]|nr:DNA-binding protein [Spirochaetota bacterium]
MEEKDIYNQKLPIEQKMFFFDLKSTPQGEYLKVTEKRNAMRNTIKIPVTGLSEFKEMLQKIMDFVVTYQDYHQE